MNGRRVLFTLIACALLAAACRQRPQVSTDEIVARHVAAVGGESALRRVSAWHVAAVVHDLPTPGKIQTWVESPKVRIDSSISGIDETIGYSGREGWSRTAQGIERLTGKRTRSIRDKGYVDGLLAYRASGGAITRLRDDDVDGHECHVLVLGSSKDDGATVYVDRRTFLIVKTVTPILSPRGNLMRLEVRYSDYRKVGGILMPFLTEVKADYGSYRITTQSVEVNVNLDDALFDVPVSQAGG
jgi:hypothetical protein